jgi:hypothetical protein
MLHVLELGWNDDTVVVTAIAWPETHQLVRLCIDEGDAAGEALEPAEDADHIFPVISHGESLHVRSNSLDFLLDLPGRGIDNHDPARCRRGVKDGQIKLCAVHGKHHAEWVRIFAAPQGIFDMGNF